MWIKLIVILLAYAFVLRYATKFLSFTERD